MNDKFAGQCSELTERILACAYDVHARLGPGLLESAYGACLVHCLKKLGLHVETEVPIGIEFDDLVVPVAYRADVIVERAVLLELKATERLLGIHCAQARTYLRHSRTEVALLLNFNVARLSNGIRRFDRRTAWNVSSDHPPRTPILPVLPTAL